MVEPVEETRAKHTPLDTFGITDDVLDEGPWYTIITAATSDDVTDTLAHLFTVTGRLHSKRGNGDGDTDFDDVTATAETILSTQPNEPLDDIDGVKVWWMRDTGPTLDRVLSRVCIWSNVVIVDNLATLGGNLGEIRDNIDRVLTTKTDLLIADELLTITSDDRDDLVALLDSLLAAGVNLQRDAAHRAVAAALDSAGEHDSDGSPGRPPIGFEIDDAGERIPDDDYAEVREVLRRVILPDDQRGSMSKSEAARYLSCSRRTIYRALDRPERYNL